MIEWLAFPAVLLAAALFPQRDESDSKKIQTIFENVGYYIHNKHGEVEFPILRKKLPIMEGDKEIGKVYSYQLPLGLPAAKMIKLDKQDNLFGDGLGKHVISEFNRELGFFEVKVFK